MANPLQQNGALAEPSKYAPLHINRFFTGFWTNSNPLRDAATPYLYEKFYAGSRFERLIDGLNIEISSRLTPIRRPGFSVYNSQNFLNPYSYFAFRPFNAGTQTNRVVVDATDAVYDGTGPSTKQQLYTKPVAAPASFIGIGNVMYFGDGTNQMKWIYPLIVWAANTVFSVGQIIVDTNFNLQQVTAVSGDAKTGAVQPAWNAAVRGTTTDNHVTWTNRGSPVQSWQVAAPTVAPDMGIAGNMFYWHNANWSTVGVVYIIEDNNGNFQQIKQAVFTNGTQYPVFNKQLAGLTNDGGVSDAWTNRGPAVGWQASTAYPSGQCILDINGHIQQAQSAFTSGATQPTWSTTINATTADGGGNWKYVQAGALISLGSVTFAYAYHTITGGVTSISPTTTIQGPIIGNGYGVSSVNCQGVADGQVDQIWVYRTSLGGSTLLFDMSGANTGPGVINVNGDVQSDNLLNTQLPAAATNQNDPPQAGLVALELHQSRIWGAVGNLLKYSSGPDAVNGSNASEAFLPSNRFTLPSQIIANVSTAIGMLVFTVSDIYIVLGRGITGDPFYVVPFLPGIGILNQNAITKNGSTLYLYCADHTQISLDVGAGVVEIGFPIGDKLLALDPNDACVAWHVSGEDRGLYVGSIALGGWYRMNPTPAPETGLMWSPPAQPQLPTWGRFSSVEVVKGTKQLLVGQANGPIYKRDLTVNTDAGNQFPAFGTIGSIVLAQAGQLADIRFLLFESVKVGTPLTPYILLGEIAETANVKFEKLPDGITDPPDLAASDSLNSLRYYLIQNEAPVFARHCQIKFDFGTQAVASELLTYALYGAISNEIHQ